MPVPSHQFDDLPCAIAVVDDGGHLLDVNAALSAMLQRDRAWLIGQSINVLFPQSGRLLYHTYVAPQLQSTGRVDEVAISLSPSNGPRVDTLFSALRRDTDQGGVVRCVFLPMTERKQLERQLLTAKRVADAVPSLLFQLQWDALGHTAFVYATDAMQDLFEVSPAQAFHSAQAVWQTIHPADAPGVMQALSHAAQTLQPWRAEFRVCLSGGDGWRDVHATPRREPDGSVLLNGCMADITERKRMESGLREKAAAEQANLAKSAFLSRVSHELRTPLNGILGFTRLLQMQASGNLRSDQINKLGYIELAGESLLRLINEVLDISRIEAGHMQMAMGEVDVRDVVGGALQLLAPMAAQRGVQLSWQCEVDVPWVHADTHRLGQVLVNLLSNAIKYGPANGLVAVEAHAQQGRVVLSVRDQGPGLSPEQQAQLFQPFNRLGAERGSVEGVGLGLVITRNLVELMSGQLQVSSVPGQGCCFSVQLQSAARSAPAVSPGVVADLLPDASSPGGETVAAPQVPWRVLYVEDNQINAILMQSLFDDALDFELQVVSQAEAALRVATQWRPDVMLMDMHLADTDGLALLGRLRRVAHGERLPCIAVSADAMQESVDAALAAGFLDYWTKPLDVTRVLPTLRQILAKAPRVTAQCGV